LRVVGTGANIPPVRRVSWVRAALKEFGSFPAPVQDQMKFALEIAAAGAMADIAKPMKGLDPGSTRSPCFTAATPSARSMR